MKIEEHAEIAGSSSEVAWAVLCDIERWSDWLPTVDRVVAEVAGTPAGHGAAYAVTQPRLGTARWVVTQWSPDVGFTWESRRPGLVTVGTHVLAPRGDGCSATVGIEWTGLLGGLAGLVYRRLTRRYLAQEVDALRRRVETS